jgi:hypothetical protein
MPPTELLSALLDLVRAAAREDSAQALDHLDATATRSASPLVDKRALADALGVSTATVDWLCRQGRIPGRIPCVHVGDVRPFNVETVRAALRAAARSGSRDVAGSARGLMVEMRLVAASRRPRRLGVAPS